MAFDPNDPDTKAGIAALLEEATGGLKSKVEELIASEKKLKQELRTKTEIKPEDVAALETELEKSKGELTAAQKLAKDATARAEKAEKGLETESGFTRKLLVENGLKDVLLQGGVKDPDFLDALVTKFSQGATVVSEGDVRKAMAGDKELSVVVTEYLTSDAGKKFVAAPNNSGGGSGGGGGQQGGGKTMPRSEFDALDQAGRMAFTKEGGKVVDLAA